MEISGEVAIAGQSHTLECIVHGTDITIEQYEWHVNRDNILDMRTGQVLTFNPTIKDGGAMFNCTASVDSTSASGVITISVIGENNFKQHKLPHFS